MRKTVVGTFDSRAEAEQVAELLMERGCERGVLDIRATETTTGATAQASRESSSWWEWLFGESEDRSYYSERMNQGGAILAVTTNEAGAERARRLMEAEGGDVAANEPSTDAAPARHLREGSPLRASGAGQSGEGEVLPIVEERLRVGKRPVASGAVRVYSRITDRPVEERVALREEHVRVERRPVDRALGEAATFREDSIEIEETSEEVVVAKEARVVEEVVVSKDIEERVEEVRDRVRRTEIEVERHPASTERSGAGQGDEADFRRHWTETGRTSGLPYEQSEGAYRFGCDLAGDAPGDAKDWSAVEQHARRRWEDTNPGTWERFKDSIRYAWERAGRRRAA